MRGQLLLAAPSLDDPNFHQSVVLLIAENDDGLLGVILNSPLEVTVADALGENVESAAEIAQPLYRGGPCRGPMMVLHGDDLIDGQTVVPGVRYTDDREAIERVMSTNDPARSKYFIGYAGWGAEQLEREIAEGSWLLTPATQADAFADAEDLWQRLSVRATLGRFVKPGDIPPNPNLN